MAGKKGIDGVSSFSYGPNKLGRGIAMLCLVLLAGTLGYMLIEGWNLLDALYMTVITITTVGFGEIKPVSESGRFFTIFLIFLGMGIIAYTLGMVAQIMVEFQVQSIFGRRKLGLRIKSLKNHYIICGFGRIGKIISQELKARGIPQLVIDYSSEARESLEQSDIPYIIDDATNEDVLIEAGIERAKGLVSVVLTDADNVFICMTGRVLNADLFIVARADEEKAEKKLLRAGADKVVLPYLIGGQEMANTIIKPAVADFLELTIFDKDIELAMEEIRVKEGSRLHNVSLGDSGIRQETNIIIVAIREKEGRMSYNPSSETRIEVGNTLIALGQSAGLKKLALICAGE